MIRNAGNYLILGVGIVLFGLICFAWAVVASLLWPVLPARTGRRLGRRGAMRGFRIFMTTMEAVGA